MTLKNWQDNGWLRSHKTLRPEIRDLLRIADLDLKVAGRDLPADWCFGIA